ncbi:MAG: hypothetical protein WKF30_09040 [Pyrinomonadaceae bacterium]
MAESYFAKGVANLSEPMEAAATASQITAGILPTKHPATQPWILTSLTACLGKREGVGAARLWNMRMISYLRRCGQTHNEMNSSFRELSNYSSDIKSCPRETVWSDAVIRVAPISKY